MSLFYLSLCALAYVIGLPFGVLIGSWKRSARTFLLPLLMIAPPFCLGAWMFHIVNDDIGPVFWTGVALVHFSIPLVFWCIATGSGYYLGRNRRLNQIAEHGGQIG